MDYTFEVVGTACEKDILSPIVTSVEVNDNITVGQDVVIKINAEDDKSGIKSISVFVKGPYEDKESYGAELNAEGIYEIRIPVTNETQAGIYEIDQIIASDNENNYLYLYEHEINKQFRIYGTNTEVEGNLPIANKAWINGRDFNPGDKITFNVDAIDKIAGIKDIELTYLNKNGEELSIGNFKKESYWSSYTAEIEADLSKISGGKWEFKEARITNNDDKTRVYKRNGNDDEIINYNDFRIITDTNHPYIVQHTFDKENATIGETVKVMIEARDDDSGIDKVLIEFRPNGRYVGLRNFEAVYNSETGLYEYDFIVDENTISAEWSIDIDVSDNEENTTSYGGGKTFTVSDTGIGVHDYIPNIKGVKIDKNKATVNDEILVQVNIENKILEAESVRVWVDKPTLNEIENIQLIYNENTNMYEGIIQVNEDTMSGKWEFSDVIITDTNNNEHWYGFYGELPSLSCEVYDTNNTEDVTVPTFGSSGSDNNWYSVGDIAKIYVNARDNQSGIKNITLKLGNENIGEIELTDFIYNEQTKCWEANFEILPEYSYGRVDIKKIIIEDNAGNVITTGDDWWLGNFHIEQRTLYIEDIIINKNDFILGDTIELSIKLNDSYLTNADVRINYEVLGEWWNSIVIDNFIYNVDTGYYDTSFIVNEYINNGTWTPSNVEVNIGDMTNYLGVNFEIANRIMFSVSGNEVDIGSPKLIGVSVDKEEVVAGDSVNITMDIEESGAISSAYATLQHKENLGITLIPVEIISMGNNTVVGRVEISSNTINGPWELHEISLYDISNNSTYLDKKDIGDKNITINVSGNDININDYIRPTLENIYVNKSIGTAGEEIIVTASVLENSVKSKNMKVVFRNDSERFTVSMKYNNVTNQYEGTVKVTNYIKLGKWSIDYVSISNDSILPNLIKYTTIYNGEERDYFSEGRDLSHCDFNVINEEYIEDIESPEFIDIYINKNTATVGEVVTLTLDAIDSGSGISSIKLMYDGKGGEVSVDNSVDFFYNPDTEKYEGSFIITNYLFENRSVLQPHSIIIEDFAGNMNSYWLLDRSDLQLKITKQDIICDVNGDGEVNILDLAQISLLYNVQSIEDDWNEKCDLNKDGIIDLYDLILLSKKL